MLKRSSKKSVEKSPNLNRDFYKYDLSILPEVGFSNVFN